MSDLDHTLASLLWSPRMEVIGNGATQRSNSETRHDLDLVRWTILTGMAYLPSTVPPIGLGASGLPIGIQVVAPYGADRTTIRLAARIAELTGGYQVPPIAR